MTLDAQAPSSPRLRIVLSAALLTVYAVAVTGLFYLQSMEWPHEGSMVYAAFFLLCPGILFQSYNLVYMLRTGRRMARRALTRLVTVPLGLAMAALLTVAASALAMSRFETAYASFVGQVGANLPAPCRAAGSYFELPAVAAYNLEKRDQPATLHHDAKRFVLAFQGGSADIDGSTIYHDSGAGAWRKFHNDDSDAQMQYAALTAGLAQCALKRNR